MTMCFRVRGHVCVDAAAVRMAICIRVCGHMHIRMRPRRWTSSRSSACWSTPRLRRSRMAVIGKCMTASKAAMGERVTASATAGAAAAMAECITVSAAAAARTSRGAAWRCRTCVCGTTRRLRRARSTAYASRCRPAPRCANGDVHSRMPSYIAEYAARAWRYAFPIWRAHWTYAYPHARAAGDMHSLRAAPHATYAYPHARRSRSWGARARARVASSARCCGCACNCGVCICRLVCHMTDRRYPPEGGRVEFVRARGGGDGEMHSRIGGGGGDGGDEGLNKRIGGGGDGGGGGGGGAGGMHNRIVGGERVDAASLSLAALRRAFATALQARARGDMHSRMRACARPK